MATKRCSYCGEVKDESEFPKASRNKDGLSYWCKDCYSKRAGHKRHKKSEYMPETKKCITCGLVKTRAEFSLHGTSCSGLKGECIECEKDRQLKKSIWNNIS